MKESLCFVIPKSVQECILGLTCGNLDTDLLRALKAGETGIPAHVMTWLNTKTQGPQNDPCHEHGGSQYCETFQRLSDTAFGAGKRVPARDPPVSSASDQLRYGCKFSWLSMPTAAHVHTCATYVRSVFQREGSNARAETPQLELKPLFQDDSPACLTRCEGPEKLSAAPFAPSTAAGWC